ncbi:MAG: ABC transporter ATP-binding protein [Bacteroidota bacterium]
MVRIHQLKHNFKSTHLTYPEWEVPQGGQAVILGNSGSGKTTLLHLIGGLLQCTSGEIVIGGERISEFGSAELDSFRGKNIGIVFQQAHLVRSLSVAENLQLAQYLAGSGKDSAKIKEVLHELDIFEIRDRKIYQISQGQAQRVSIARAVIHAPKLLLADEPTASLDDENCERVLSLLKRQALKTESTLIIATHDQRVKAKFNDYLSL